MLTAFPLRQTLQTVHHGTIITVGGRCEHNEQEADIEASHALLLVPCDARELLSRQFEGGLLGAVEIHCECWHRLFRVDVKLELKIALVLQKEDQKLGERSTFIDAFHSGIQCILFSPSTTGTP